MLVAAAHLGLDFFLMPKGNPQLSTQKQLEMPCGMGSENSGMQTSVWKDQKSGWSGPGSTCDPTAEEPKSQDGLMG